MEEKERKPFRSILRKLPNLFVAVLVLWVFINFINFIQSAVKSVTADFTKLNTVEKFSYITGVFHIRDTTNVASYSFSVKDVLMVILLSNLIINKKGVFLIDEYKIYCF